MADVNASNKSIPNLTRIAPSIWEYSPPSIYIRSSSSSKNGKTPSLIVIYTWTGAQNRYIAKYTAVYERLFPSTRIVVVATTLKDLCFRNSQRKQERLKPAVDRISSPEHLNECGNDNGILMHAFSEGGSNKAAELAEAYHNITGKRLPVTALCLDSTSGHPRHLHLCNALNKSYLRFQCSDTQVYSLAARYLEQSGQGTGLPKVQKITSLHEPVGAFWPLGPAHFDLTALRCYLYSGEDALVAFQDVHEHAEESRRLGIPVTDVLFYGSGYVGHARQEPVRYWEEINPMQ